MFIKFIMFMFIKLKLKSSSPLTPLRTGIEGPFRCLLVSPWSTRWVFGLQNLTRGGPYECAQTNFSDFQLRARVDRNRAKSG